MKKLKASALVILAVLIAAAAMSGCNIYIGGQPSSSNGSSSSSSSTTEAPTTEQPTTVEVTTEVPTTEEPQTEAPKSEYSTESPRPRRRSPNTAQNQTEKPYLLTTKNTTIRI